MRPGISFVFRCSLLAAITLAVAVTGNERVSHSPAPAHRSPAASPGEGATARFMTEVRLRKLHLVRPDLIPYPIETEVYC